MRQISIPFGRGRQTAELDESRIAAVLTPEAQESADLSDERQIAIAQAALNAPIGSPRLAKLVEGKQRILIITSDHTRPVPSRLTMPLLLKEIRKVSPAADVRILLATGMHRPTTLSEIAQKFGPELARQEQIISHISTDESAMTDKGILPSGGRLRMNKLVDWAELVIAEGFIEPHFFAGFSGGRKAILPGIASAETVRYNHNAGFIASPYARQGILENNPLHRDMLYAAQQAGLAFILNVLIDEEKRIVAAVAGDPVAAHEAGCKLCMSRTGVARVQSPIVITSNGGYPLDQNLYQSVKGLTAGEACVAENGVIILVTECSDGHGGESFYHALADRASARETLNAIEGVPPEQTPPDQWEAQILCRVLCRAKVIVVTLEKNRELVTDMHMTYAPTLQSAIQMAEGMMGVAPITVIPDGVGVIVR